MLYFPAEVLMNEMDTKSRRVQMQGIEKATGKYIYIYIYIYTYMYLHIIKWVIVRRLQESDQDALPNRTHASSVESLASRLSVIWNMIRLGCT